MAGGAITGPFVAAAQYAARRLGFGAFDAASGNHGTQGTAWAVPYAGANGFVVDLALGTAGQVLTSGGAAAAPTFATPTVITTKYKANTEGVTNSSTLQNDDDLFFAVAASAVWQFEFSLLLHQPLLDTPDFKIAFTSPASPTSLYWGAHGYGSTSTAALPVPYFQHVSGSGTAITFGLIGSDLTMIYGGGVLVNGANAGNLNLQWCQANADAQTLYVYPGSWLRGIQIA